MDTVKLDEMTKEEACAVLDDMKVKIDIPHAAVMQRKRNEALDMAISALSESDNVGMSMSHRAIAKVIDDYVDNHRGDSDKQYTALEIKLLLISDDSDNKGEWIYDKGINNWRCSRCGQTPPPTGYVGKADFMATYFKFCPNCRADMQQTKSEDKTK